MRVSRQRSDEFRDALKAAVSITDLQRRLSALTTLASAETGYLETIQIDRALTSGEIAKQTSHTAVRLAALGTVTMNHLLPAIRVAGLRRQLLIDVHVGQFGQYRQELLGSSSALGAFEPTALLLSLTADEFVGGVPVSASAADAATAVNAAVANLRDLWRNARLRFGALVVQQSFLDVTPSLFGSHDRLIPGAPSRLVGSLNDALAQAAAEEGVLFLDIAAASARDGIAAWYDERSWHQGKILIAPTAAVNFGDLLARLIGAHLGRSRKVLVLDLDNTLWGGVVGDDGLEGVKLGQGTAVGEAHLALQKYAKQLKERGIVLAVCSKNDRAIVESMFDRHPEMLLRREDISVFAVNWNDKVENLRTISQQLNLGVDSFVFVDDNPVERTRVREALPMVAVPELPDEPAYFVRAIAGGGYFEAVALTNEDRERTAQYVANADRDNLRASACSIDDFLRSLEMSTVFGPITRIDLARAGQLINKTNQFNLTALRLTEKQLEERTVDPAALTLQFRLSDRFGDNGLVSVMLFRRDPDLTDALELENWVMSCRVFGRQLEHEAMNVAVESARKFGARKIKATYLPTEKNVVVSELFKNLGFNRAASHDDCSCGTTWLLDIDRYVPHTTHIVRKVRRDD